jgi:hypothetical protein
MEWVIIFGLGSSCYVIHKVIISMYEYDHSNVSKTWRYILGWLIFLSVFGSYYYYEDTIKIKDGGVYYVNLFETKDAQKNYRVPALINIDEDGYRLSEVYWSNGGELNFYDDNTLLVIGEKVELMDNEKKDWFVELTAEKAAIKK